MKRFSTDQLTTIIIILLLIVFAELTIFNNGGAFLLIIGALLLYYSFSKRNKSLFLDRSFFSIFSYFKCLEFTIFHRWYPHLFTL